MAALQHQPLPRCPQHQPAAHRRAPWRPSLALQPRDPQQGPDPDRAIWHFPTEELPGGEAAWGDVLDALRPRVSRAKLWQWRKETELQPVVFRDPQEVNADRVHLHLEHPLVMRLLNRFLMRGFQSDA